MTEPAAWAIVLAGGRSTRFGGPKLGALVDGVPLLHRAIEAVAAVTSEIVVVAGPGEAPDLPSSAVPIRVVNDPEPDPGPLRALVEGLRVTTAPSALVVGGDMPRLSPRVLAAMLERLASGSAAAVILGPAVGAARLAAPAPRQSLPMALDVSRSRIAADAVIAARRRSLQALLDAVAVEEIAAEAWLPLDPTAGTLLDIDEPADLPRAVHRRAR